MRHLRTFIGTGALAAALLLALGLSASPARAATSVDVTYDLSDSSVIAKWFFSSALTYSNDRPLNGTVSGSMKVRYSSDSSSGMPIQSGPATLVSFNLRIQDTVTGRTITQGYGGANAFTTIETNPYVAMTATFNWQLTASAAGNFTANGALTGLSGNVLLTGRADCKFPYRSGCAYYFGIGPSPVYPSYSKIGTFNLAGLAGPNSGTASTRHTLTGSAPINVPFGGNPAGWKLTRNYLGNALVGREIRREADGHDPKVIPEPGTLLLLGAGAAGLGALGRTHRRRTRERA